MPPRRREGSGFVHMEDPKDLKDPKERQESQKPQALQETRESSDEIGAFSHRHLNKRVTEGTFKTFLGLGILLILAAKIIFDFKGFRSFIGEAVDLFFSLLSYLLFGFLLAYVLNAYMMWLERRPLGRMKPSRGKRYLSIVLAYITLFAFIAFLIFAIVPKLVDTIGNLAQMVPDLFRKVYQFYLDVVEGGRFNLPDGVKEAIVKGIDDARAALTNFANVDRITTIGMQIVTAAGNGIFNLIMSLLVSVYMLLEKDNAVRASKSIVAGLFKPASSARIFDAGRKIDMIFRRYFTGKLMQAIVILVLSYIVLLIGRVDYAILFAVILGFTNMIPYIGPWIGAVPVVLISLVQDPWMGIRALICVLVVQMLDNWFITPKVVGGKMGISPLLVLIGLCVGGRLFGFVGMLIGDVLAAIVKVFFYDSFVAKRIRKKVADGALPPDYLDPPDEAEGADWFSRVSGKVRATVSRWRKPKK